MRAISLNHQPLALVYYVYFNYLWFRARMKLMGHAFLSVHSLINHSVGADLELCAVCLMSNWMTNYIKIIQFILHVSPAAKEVKVLL